VDVVSFRKRVGHDLTGETNTDFFGIRTGIGQHPVIESTAAAESTAASIEGKARTKKGVDLVDQDFGEGGGWLADTKGSGDQLERGILDGVKPEFILINARINPAVVGMAGD
jgi:hypothetical protein